ncbi:TreP [Staphylococcus phage P4W]|uniref:TreP n=1 Tax=Staphylococcus phage P4W TaxID=1195080 RepID=I6XKF0_9CAUD|nr:TreP [Staphylococcus phage P4W]YP_009781843.1 TreP [Staphylococcus phage P4W]AFN38874.1 TreP [Staphylococcus phage P4W]AHL83313.1 TreP [Staphylococcus phage P4W]
MKFIKTIENLLNKAENKGQAILNGRYYDGYRNGELEEKYAIEIDGNKLIMRHWGTQTIEIDLSINEIVSYYGESNSDRDSLNTLVYCLGIAPNFRYLPSKDLFIYEN